MAKKVRKTKVGKFLQKASNKVKEVVSRISGVNLAGNVVSAVSKPKVTQQPSGTTVGKTFYSSDGKTSSAFPSNPAKGKTVVGGLEVDARDAGVVSDFLNKGTQSTVDINKATRSGGLTFSSRQNKEVVPNLDKALAPNSADSINNIESLNLSLSGNSGTGTMGVSGGSTAGAMGALAGLETQNDLTIKQKEAEQARLDADAAQKKQDKSILNIFKDRENEPTISETRADLEKEYGIKSQIAEINSLTESLGKMEVEVQNQVAMANDKLGSNNFINNQIQQIERNAAPALNRLRADINFKTGILTQNQELIQQAISDATAESRQKWEDKKWFIQQNQNVIDRLDKRYQDALRASEKEDERSYQYQLDLHKWKVEMIERYGLKASSINDSEETILQKVANLGYQPVNDRNDSSSPSGKLTPAQQKTYEAYKSQIGTYESKEEAIKELDAVKFSVIKAIGQAGYDLLVQEISNSTLPDESLSWWDKLLGRG